MQQISGAVSGVIQAGRNRHDAGHADQIGKKRVLLSRAANVRGCAENICNLLEAHGHEVMILDVESVSPEEALECIQVSEVDGAIDVALNALAALQQTGSTEASLLTDLIVPTGKPLVAAPGDLDTVTFASREAVPPQFGRRNFHPASTVASVERVLMRADVSESARLGRALAEKLNPATGKVAVCLPLRGLSSHDVPGGPLSSMNANMALFGNLTTQLRRDIRLYDCNVGINSPAFARLCFETLVALLTSPTSPPRP